MGDWENLPEEILILIYSYLPRRERLACSLVCDNWKYGLDHVMLWKTTTVHIDTDLMEPSTMLMVRDHCKHIKNLEFGWAIPNRTNRWLPLKYKELTKRAVRFFLILYDSYIQITCLRIFNWFDFVSFQKVIYHLSRFLKNQIGLDKIIFDNINLQSPNYIKILTSCLNSKSTITHLDIRSCYYCQSTFNSVYFRSCIDQLTYLKVFKLDYFILSCELIESILTSNNRYLECLEIILKETSWHDRVINEEQWCLLISACPNLKVALTIRNIYHYGDLRLYLKQSIPVVSLSIALPKILEKGGRCNYRKSLNLLVNYYHRTLETVDLNVNNDGENLDDVLLMMIRRCFKLKSLVFNGIIEDPKSLKTSFQSIFLLWSTRRLKQNFKSPRRCVLILYRYNNIFYSDVTCFYMTPNGLMYQEEYEDCAELRRTQMQFTFLKENDDTSCTLIYLN